MNIFLRTRGTRSILLMLVLCAAGCSRSLAPLPVDRAGGGLAAVSPLCALPPEPEPEGAAQESTAPTSGSLAQKDLDEALGFYEAASELWQQGQLENALAELDKAYGLLLHVNEEADQALLQQKEDMRVTIARRILEVYASRFNAVNGRSNAIPLVMNEHVEKALHAFKTRERRFFLESYVRAGQYRPMIVAKLREEGLPEDLSWLPLIESGFKVRALSRARALGMWQFIASTGYKFGLERNAWIDERMDPEKSTEAAIAYLKELHGIFGDWSTALAAYNCGEGNVLRVIRRQQVSYLDNFWDLYTRLPYETASYVPRFLAVLHILSDPEKHGFTLPDAEPPPACERATINRHMHIKTIAKNIGLTYSELKDLNPELRKNVTPDEPYSLRVPAGKAEALLSGLDHIPVYVPPVPPYVVHRVRNGESLSVIARKYRSSVRAIMAMNNLKSSSFIRAGWKLKIPTSRRTSYASSRPARQSAQLKGNMLEYVVQKGDSLWEIANRYNTTVRALKSLNQLRSSLLSVGQVLLVPTSRA